jgi:hypothetical protein
MRCIAIISCAILVPLSSFRAQAAVIRLPGHLPSVQGRVNEALNGDTIPAAPDAYHEPADLKGDAAPATSGAGYESKLVAEVSSDVPPQVCIALPDSGLTFGDRFFVKALADSTSRDADSACLWYRSRRDLEDPLLHPGPWTECRLDPCCCMMRPGGGHLFTDTTKCLEGTGYVGWVEMIVVACDEAGNCQDTTMGYGEACLVLYNETFRTGHFLFYWDTLAPGVAVVEVDGHSCPQSSCGYGVWWDSLNWAVLDVPGAGEDELFEVEVRAIVNDPSHTIFHQDNCAMPCTVWFGVDGWPQGTQNIYFHVTDHDNGKTGNAQVQVCVQAPVPNPFSLLFPPNKAFTPRAVRFDWETATHPDPLSSVDYDLYVSTSYYFSPDSTTVENDLAISEHKKLLDYGTYYWKVKAKDNQGAETWSNQVGHFIVTGLHQSTTGDFNADGSIDAGDLVFAVNYLYRAGPPPDPSEAGDCNCDGTVNVGDVVYLVSYLFRGGPPPCGP